MEIVQEAGSGDGEKEGSGGGVGDDGRRLRVSEIGEGWMWRIVLRRSREWRWSNGT